ncbi:hypothetical protein BP422_12140 [Brevibacillus formosus]|uniref:Uncharacterized protein n=1 Tax=Brevibacillus formosus TaxID=54913 RepID=A0A220MGP8_9BACL|nr:hypothetical protein [Brevibacillus formosus]ASJ54231.1 hypothetical protein BP422_12140 [Brevibacillus formosus]
MNITLNIEAANPGELQEAIVGLAGIVGFVNDGTGIQLPTNKEDGEKPKRGNRSTSKPDKQQAPESDSKAEDKVEDKKANEDSSKSSEEEDGGGGEDVPSASELLAKAQQVGTTPEAKKAIRALLEKFGSKSISNVPEDKRAEFMAELDLL